MDSTIKPPITVLMAVYNGEKYLKECIDSILNQSFTNFEFLIIDDGSSDQTIQIIKNYEDKRIVCLSNEKNSGCVHSLNKGMKLAKGKYIARMDADDIAHPAKLEKQYNFLLEHPEIDIIGCHINYIDENGTNINSHHYPVSDKEIKANLIFGSPFAHPCVVFNKEKFIANDLFYIEEYHYAEDYDLWQRALDKLNGTNFDEILIDYRISANQVSNKHYEKQQIADQKIKLNSLKKFDLTPSTISDIQLFLKEDVNSSLAVNFHQVLESLSILVLANEKTNIFESKLIKKNIATKLDKIVNLYSSKKFKLFNIYKKSLLYQNNRLSTSTKVKCYIKQYLRS